MEGRALANLLQQSFSESRQLYPHWSGDLQYTEGVSTLAQVADAYWMIDLIASLQPRASADASLKIFQLWEFQMRGHSGVAICQRDLGDEAFRYFLTFVQFPLESVTFYVVDGVLKLPSEH